MESVSVVDIILLYVSETAHVTVITLHFLYGAHSGLYRDTTLWDVSPLLGL